MLKKMTDAQGYRNHAGEPYVRLYDGHQQTEALPVSELREAMRILEAAIFEALVLSDEDTGRAAE
jgi:hypothetical protein